MMSRPRYYPSWVFHINENITRRNMAEYDRQQARIDKRCLELAPDYYQLHIVHRIEIRRQAERELYA